MRPKLAFGRTTTWLTAILSLNLLAYQACRADPVQDPPAETTEEASLNAKHSEMLRSQKYDQLDREMNQVQQEYEAGERSDINLLHLFRAFYDTDPSLKDRYSEWIRRFPQSYAAHESQGIYFRRVGYQARGTEYAKDTSSEKLSEMERYLNLSAQSHYQAIKLSAKPLLSYFSLLSIARLSGDGEAAQQMLRRAVEIAPNNFIARYKYMLMLEGRWGGSLAAMKAFRTESQNAGISASLLQYFDELISDEVRWQQAR